MPGSKCTKLPATNCELKKATGNWHSSITISKEHIDVIAAIYIVVKIHIQQHHIVLGFFEILWYLIGVAQRVNLLRMLFNSNFAACRTSLSSSAIRIRSCCSGWSMILKYFFLILMSMKRNSEKTIHWKIVERASIRHFIGF